MNARSILGIVCVTLAATACGISSDDAPRNIAVADQEQLGVAADRAALPLLSLEQFRQSVIQAPRNDRRVAALFAHPERDAVELVMVLAADGEGSFEAAARRITKERT